MNSYGYDDAAGAGFLAFNFAFTVIVYVLNAWFLSKVFNKMGIKGWRAWVPLYGQWVFLRAGGFQGYWIFLAFLSVIPIVNFFAWIALLVIQTMAAYRINSGFHRSALWTVLYFFFSIIWAGILAFNSDYYDPEEARANGANPDVYPEDRAELGVGTNYNRPYSNPYNN